MELRFMVARSGWITASRRVLKEMVPLLVEEGGIQILKERGIR